MELKTSLELVRKHALQAFITLAVIVGGLWVVMEKGIDYLREQNDIIAMEQKKIDRKEFQLENNIRGYKSDKEDLSKKLETLDKKKSEIEVLEKRLAIERKTQEYMDIYTNELSKVSFKKGPSCVSDYRKWHHNVDHLLEAIKTLAAELGDDNVYSNFVKEQRYKLEDDPESDAICGWDEERVNSAIIENKILEFMDLYVNGFTSINFGGGKECLSDYNQWYFRIDLLLETIKVLAGNLGDSNSYLSFVDAQREKLEEDAEIACEEMGLISNSSEVETLGDREGISK